MATLTREELAERVLQYLTVTPAGQSASAEDTFTAEEAVDAVYSSLRALGIAPFALTAIPEWAQVPLRNYVAAVIAYEFGRAMPIDAVRADSERELRRQVAGIKHAIPIKLEPY